MKLYPIKSSFYERESCIYYNNEAKGNQPTFFGDFGEIYIDDLRDVGYIEHVRFELKHQTWVFYKFSESRSMIIHAIDKISFKLGERRYEVEPNDFLHISGYSSPQFLLFPQGNYEFYLISGVVLETELHMQRLKHYDKIRAEINDYHKQKIIYTQRQKR